MIAQLIIANLSLIDFGESTLNEIKMGQAISSINPFLRNLRLLNIVHCPANPLLFSRTTTRKTAIMLWILYTIKGHSLCEMESF